jgi:hypothetical protein
MVIVAKQEQMGVNSIFFLSTGKSLWWISEGILALFKTMLPIQEDDHDNEMKLTKNKWGQNKGLT